MVNSRSLWFAATLLMLWTVRSESAFIGEMTLIPVGLTLGAALANMTWFHSKAHHRNSGSSQPSFVFFALLVGTMRAGFVAAFPPTRKHL